MRMQEHQRVRELLDLTPGLMLPTRLEITSGTTETNKFPVGLQLHWAQTAEWWTPRRFNKPRQPISLCTVRRRNVSQLGQLIQLHPVPGIHLGTQERTIHPGTMGTIIIKRPNFSRAKTNGEFYASFDVEGPSGINSDLPRNTKTNLDLPLFFFSDLLFRNLFPFSCLSLEIFVFFAFAAFLNFPAAVQLPPFKILGGLPLSWHSDLCNSLRSSSFDRYFGKITCFREISKTYF